MRITKFQPLFAPNDGNGSGGGIGSDVDNNDTELDAGDDQQQDQQDQRQDGPGSGRTPIRKELEKSFRTNENRDVRRQPPRRQARQQVRPDQQDDQGQVQGDQQDQQQDQQRQVEPPAALSKEAKAEWAQTPPAVQAAFVKREEDIARGVAALKQHYNDIDTALKPRLDVIRAHGQTPAQAVNQLFSWFEALNQDRERVKNGQAPIAFINLLQSFGLHPQSLYMQQDQQQDDQGQADPVQRYIKQLEDRLAKIEGETGQRLGALQGTLEEQSYNRTQEFLEAWSQGKPHFEEVRQTMGRLIAAGAVPLLPNGRADLDKAYDMALYAVPEVRAKVLADQKKREEQERRQKLNGERAAQQSQSDRARRAAVGLAPSAPGAPAGQQQKNQKKGLSVAESLREAIKEVSDASQI